MALGVRELGHQPLVEVLAVERAGQTVDHAALITQYEGLLFPFVGETEPKRNWSERDSISILQATAPDGLASHGGPVVGSQILDDVVDGGRMMDARDASVSAADVGMIDPNFAVRRASDHRRSGERIDGSCFDAAEQRQRTAAGSL